VLNCIFGWQYFNKKEPEFRDFCYQQTRDMVRRDRNHPSILAWESSLNETKQPADFIAELSRLVHEEYPAPYCYSAGWQRGWDIYVESRQFRIFNNVKEHDVPLIVSEYGDWEYYANDGGLTQYVRGWRQKPELTSRQLREHGEKRMVQMVENLNTAHIDNLTSVKAMADGYWVMFDYNRGYTEEIEASGVMSHDRLPKYAYYYYRSLRPEGEPMVYIASYLDENSPAEKSIISNCEVVKLISDGKEVGELRFDPYAKPLHTLQKVALPNCNNLVAIGFRNGKEVARHEMQTAGKAVRLVINEERNLLRSEGVKECRSADNTLQPQNLKTSKPISTNLSTCQLVNSSTNKLTYLNITAVDSKGRIVPGFNEPITVSVEGAATLYSLDNHDHYTSDLFHGVSTKNMKNGRMQVILRGKGKPGAITIKATTPKLKLKKKITK
jgi:beta-galactosidase